MVRSLLSFAAVVALLGQQVIGAPAEKRQGWGNWCTPEQQQKNVRVSFASLTPAQRKAYTDAVNCVHSQPSQLNNAQYPAAVNKYQDYAVIHVERTSQVHLSGYFLTWHRNYLHLFEHDLRTTCGYKGPFPYWDFAATADQGNLVTSAVFDGSEYSLSGNGAPNGTAPIALGPSLVVPHGTGGGCVTTGPFKDWILTLGYIDPLFLISGQPLPPTAYNYNASCLIRDLNQYVDSTYCNTALVEQTVHSASAADLENNMNGVIGGSTLGVHSAGHFTVGGFMDSIHVSVQDPVWWALHANIDRIYTSWQAANPAIADQLYGTMTANNAPPSANVTLDSLEPDWGYFQGSVPVRDLIYTNAGPFCYTYDHLYT